MTEYLLVFRDHDQKWPSYSQEQKDAVVAKFDIWREDLKERGAFVSAGKLSEERGTTVRKDGADFVVDGPFSEAKEAIAGFYLVKANSPQEAAEIAKSFPMLDDGGSVEVRELLFVQQA